MRLFCVNNGSKSNQQVRSGVRNVPIICTKWLEEKNKQTGATFELDRGSVECMRVIVQKESKSTPCTMPGFVVEM